MAELHVVATISVREGTADTVGPALEKLARVSRGDAGCLAYDVYRSQAVPDTFVTIERWESQADLDAHIAAPHVAEAFADHGHDIITATIHPLAAM